MKHPSTQVVFQHWNAQRGLRPAPQRGDIDPLVMRRALGDTILMAADFADQLRFRLAGTNVCALFCREIKGEAFSALWGEASLQAIDELLASVIDESAGAVAGVNARTNDGERLELELLLLPLAHDGHTRIRVLGVLAPTGPPYWLGVKPLTDLELTTLRYVGPGVEQSSDTPSLQAPASSRIRHGFVVYTGGRQARSGQRTG